MLKVTRIGPAETITIRPQPIIVFGPAEVVQTEQNIIITAGVGDPYEVEQCEQESKPN